MAEKHGASTTVAAPAPNKTVRLYHIGGYKNTNNAPRPEVDSYHQYKNPMNQQNFLPNLFSQQQAQYQQQGPYKQPPLGYPNRDLIIYDKKTKCYYKIEDDDSDDDDDDDESEDDDEDDDESEEETEEDSQEEETDSGEEYESEDGNNATVKTQRSRQQIEEKPQMINAAEVVGKEQKEASEGSEEEEEEDSEQETEAKDKDDKLNVSQKTVGSEGAARSLEGSDGTSLLAVDGDGMAEQSQESSEQKKKAFLKNHAIKGQVKKTVVTDKKLEITDDAVTKMETPLPKAKKDRRLSEVSKKSNGSASNLDVINESAREMATESAVFMDENSKPEQSAAEADQVAKEERADVTDG